MINDGSLKWFGVSWDAPVNTLCEHVPTPIDEPCAFCKDPIHWDHRGVLMAHVERSRTVYRPWHLDCFLRTIVPSPEAFDAARY